MIYLKKQRLISGLISISVLALTPSMAEAAKKQPNIVLVLIDDFGWGDLGSNLNDFTKDELNQDFINQINPDYTIQEAYDAARNSTLNLSRFCNEGVRFTNAYVTSNVSSPSRAGILTASYPERYGIYLLGEGEMGVPENIKMMPQILKESGYINGVFGKWHNGNPTGEFLTASPGQHPLDRGFDYFYGFNKSNTLYYNSNIIFRNREHLAPSPEWLPDACTNEAVEFIAKNPGKPKLIYLAYNAVHGIIQPAPDKYLNRFQSKSKKLNVFSAATLSVDEGVKTVMNKLKEIGEYDNTVLVFLSDNGAIGNATSPLPKNGPFSGFKGQDYQGGFRTPMFIWYGNKIKNGKVCNQLVSSMDIFPTFMEIAGVNLPKSQPIDGVSLVPLITGKSDKEVRDNLISMTQHTLSFDIKEVKDRNYAEASFMVRKGDYSLRYFVENSTFFLNNMKTDRAEKMNLVDKNPKITEEYKHIFQNWFETVCKDPTIWKTEYWQNIKFWDKNLPAAPSITERRANQEKNHIGNKGQIKDGINKVGEE